MFEKKDFQDIAPHIRDKLYGLGSYTGIHFHRYPQYAFSPPDGEQTIQITRAPKTPGDNGIKFLLAAVWLENWQGRESAFVDYLADSAFESISEIEFNKLVANQCHDLVVKPELPLRNNGEFLGALLLYSMKTEFFVSLLAEYNDEFIHFHWDTTA